jgi:ubiquinone/menaquinone biosynthesis C-methylase UbiE
MRNEFEHTELNARKWDRRAVTYDDKRFDHFRVLQKRLISLVNPRPGTRLLDIGCGTGWAVRYAASLLGGRGRFHGIDISSVMIEKAVRNNPYPASVFFLEADSAKLAFDNNFFDTIICTNSFHHYLNPLKALREFLRVLAPGGRVYIMDFTTDEPVSRLIDRFFKKREAEHVRFYSSREYKAFLGKAGLTHIQSKSIVLEMKVHVGEKAKNIDDGGL